MSIVPQIQVISRKAVPLSAVTLLLCFGSAFAQTEPSPFALSRILPRPVRVENRNSINVALSLLVASGITGGVAHAETDTPSTLELVPEGLTVGEALARVLDGQGQYTWREADGVVNILPKSDLPLLRTVVASYEWRSNETVLNSVIGALRSPEVVARMSELGYVEGLYSVVFGAGAPKLAPAPEVTRVFVRRDLSLLDLLNEIVKTYPHPSIWRYSEALRGKQRSVTITAN